MRKLILTSLFLLGITASANANGLTAFDIRHNAHLYLKAGQLWNSQLVKDVPKVSPRWYWGGGLLLNISQDGKFQGNVELKKGLTEDFTNIDWSVQYHF